MEEHSKKTNTSVGIITLIIKWWKQLLVVAVSAMVVSLLVSFLIKPKYKSTVVMMPTASNAVSQMLLEDGNYNEFLDPSQFGDDMKVDHMLQILNSRQIKDHLIATFDLINYYELDTNKKYWQTKLYKYLQSDITFSRTNFMGVEIKVAMKNPQLAADVANEIADYYDTLKREIIQQRTVAALQIVRAEMDSLEILVTDLSDSLSRIMQHGVYDYETQSERLYQQYVKELSSGNTAACNRLKEQLQILEQWGPAYVSLRDRIMNIREMQQGIQARYLGVSADAQYEMSQKFVVERAIAADKKFYPKKSAIVIVSTLCALALALFFILCQASLKEIYKEVNHRIAEDK